MNKRELREAYRALWLSQDWIEEVARRSEDLALQLDEILQEHPAVRVGLYMAMRDEPCLDSHLSEWSRHKEIYLPRVMDSERIEYFRYHNGDMLEQGGKYQIREPQTSREAISAKDLELLVIPAIAIDSSGYRLGRGKGYYDRYLADTKASTIGITLDLMPLPSLPRDPWDIPLQMVLRPRDHSPQGLEG